MCKFRHSSDLGTNPTSFAIKSRPCRATIFAIVLFTFFCCVGRASADPVTFGNGFGSKWGDPNHGTASDIITWTFMDNSTNLHSSHPLISEVLGGAAATSDITSLRTAFNGANGAGAFDSAIQNAFNTWSAAAPGRIQFQFVGSDTGDRTRAIPPIRMLTQLIFESGHSIPWPIRGSVSRAPWDMDRRATI